MNGVAVMSHACNKTGVSPIQYEANKIILLQQEYFPNVLADYFAKHFQRNTFNQKMGEKTVQLTASDWQKVGNEKEKARNTNLPVAADQG